MIFNFTNPLFLILLLLVPLLIWHRYWSRKRKKGSYLRYSSLSLLKDIRLGWRYTLHRSLFPLKMIVILLIILALAGPQTGISYQEIETSGVDIILVLDVSSSMGSLDFEPKNRLEVAKDVVAEFVDARVNDRLGLVIFSGGAFTQSPLTLDHDLLKTLIKKLKMKMIEDGTAIGNALAVAVSRLLDSQAKSKIIILLTDGVNNRGEVAPLDAAKLAADNNIRVYTVGAGKEGTAPYPVDDPIYGKRYVQVKVEIDEEILREIAKIADGEYFRARDAAGLKKTYKKINKMEKTIIKPKYYVSYSSKFFPPLIISIILLIMVVFIEMFITKKIP